MKQKFPITNLLSALLITGLATFSSCKKDNSSVPSNSPDTANAVEAVQNDESSEAQFADVFNITMGVQSSDVGEDVGIGSGAGVIYKPASPDGLTTPDSTKRCFTVTVTPKTLHVFPKTVTLDFGNGCTGKDGKLRKGKIITIYTGPMTVPGSKATTTFENYNVDSFSIEGTHVIENTSSSNKFGWSVKVTAGKITNTQNGKWRKWDGTRQHIQTQGNGTPFYALDDVYEIGGNATGSNSNGNSWTSEIITPLVRKFVCPWIGKGQVKITRNGNTNAAILDYGDGSCDNKATITYMGITKTINL